MSNHPNRGRGRIVFYCTRSNGFGAHQSEPIRARDFRHAAEIIAHRMTGVSTCHVRLVGHGASRTATIYGDGGYRLADVHISLATSD